ncbi:glycosyltransferase family 4 protein [Natronococcus sp. A-GB7]|uniref:glycosyltransferase family 4 protein n=1 Tax=Natronococcus sp. A-GB7 TaxID=3037649 RepID=UPI00241D19DF|nr:glycosyltransferase family 4 protein [Natronococcus sp. A-GB7]MDG5818920.1 glycosyltransferase family 4 protein [Natronococcus sp. A-GB7]
MEVGLVVPDDLETTSGGYRYDRRLVAELRALGDDVEVIVLSTVPDDDVRARLDRPFDVLLQDELCYDQLVDCSSSPESPELVVSLVHNLQSDDPSLASRKRERIRERERRYLETVDAAVCTSAHTRNRVAESVDLPTTVAPPAGRHETLPVDRSAVVARVREGPLRIAFVGNLVPRKGLEALLEAVSRLEGDWELTVVGGEADPEYATRIRDRVESLEVDDRVEFAGRVPENALESIYERSHVLAVPSRHEAFGMVYLEGMEYGAVPIASRNGGSSEFVADGENGFLVAPEAPDRIAARLEELAADRDRLASLGARALETADAHPWWTETATTVRSFLRRGLEEEFESTGAESGEASP